MHRKPWLIPIIIYMLRKLKIIIVYFSAAKQPLPTEWMAMKDDENIRIVNVGSSDPIYQQIEKRFVTEVTTGAFNNRISSMKNVKVTKVLYFFFCMKTTL